MDIPLFACNRKYSLIQFSVLAFKIVLIDFDIFCTKFQQSPGRVSFHCCSILFCDSRIDLNGNSWKSRIFHLKNPDGFLIESKSHFCEGHSTVDNFCENFLIRPKILIQFCTPLAMCLETWSYWDIIVTLSLTITSLSSVYIFLWNICAYKY